MDIWKSLDGMVEAELTSAEPGAALEAANARGIPLYDVIQVGDLTARFRVRRRDYRTLEALSEKRGETLRLRRRMGAYWTLKRLLARPMLLCGLAVFLAAAIYLPTRIFFRAGGGQREHAHPAYSGRRGRKRHPLRRVPAGGAE